MTYHDVARSEPRESAEHVVLVVGRGGARVDRVPVSGLGRRSVALGGPLEGWLVPSKGRGRCPGSPGAPWALAAAGRAVGRCRCRGRPSSQPA